ncbi:MAG: phosphatidylinositol-specific phospholipase C domain-containing protein [Coxiellaceae bacterium]|nr:phosphatidylinositol-specific phospholipase C domain-containing protein [Coxiellaceae bacterium]
MNKITLKCTIVLVCLWLSNSALAWTEYMRIINNTDQSINFKFSPTKGSGAHPDTGDIAADSDGQSVGLSDGDWWQSNGDLTITQNNVSCVYRYQGVANKHSLTKLEYRSGPEQCKQANLLTEDATHDCNGPHNCVIFNPDSTWVNKALKLQRAMSYAEPMTKHQVVGTHNSAVSKHYIDNGIDRLVALNHTLSITQQLNEGVRSIELDIVWASNALRICHFHTDNNPELLCYNNAKLDSLLNEINIWMKAHPDQFVFLYFDVNHPIDAEKMIGVDKQLQQIFGSRLYTEADAYKLPLGPEGSQYNHPMPANKVSIQQLLQQGKQVVVSAHKDFENSPYVFMHLLNDHGVDDFVDLVKNQKLTCAQATQQMFQDPGHTTLWRLNGDRAWASEVAKKSDYVTVDGIYATRACRLNMFSVDELKQGDARIDAQVWSWQQGNPLTQSAQNAKPYAVIDPQTKRMNNQSLLSTVPQVLCYRAGHMPQWSVVPWNNAVASDDVVGIQYSAQQACQSHGAKFATPATSDEMSTVQSLVKTPVIVNELYSNGQWIANGGQPLTPRSS